MGTFKKNKTHLSQYCIHFSGTLSTTDKLNQSQLMQLAVDLKNKSSVPDWELDALINTIAPPVKNLAKCVTTFDWVALACEISEIGDDWMRFVHVDSSGMAYAGSTQRVHRAKVKNLCAGVYCPRTGYKLSNPNFYEKFDHFYESFSHSKMDDFEKSTRLTPGVLMPLKRGKGRFIGIYNTPYSARLSHYNDATLKGQHNTLVFSDQYKLVYGANDFGDFILTTYKTHNNQ